ncbi:HD-GYP domain-containing protein [Oceanobacillus halophilus]|uniref:HD-GYP domain-containing protein n=1 Tax=Oceanobacillus halophilus TaxID=930130 RepID=A0A494ZU63_9BACI|nr:HD-GYP domain-containing protein [Oceanobacillus halophilus]RKQ29611.1 HD-GYP domain-containing protein [Oceanobacillus halophilus]
MKLVNTKTIKPGAVLAQSIYNENGVVLISSGMSLTDKVIRRLINYGITYVYIEDERTKDIYVESLIPDKLRTEATRTIKDTFTEIKKQGIMEKSYILDKKGKELMDVVKKLTEEIKNNDQSLSMLTDIFLTDNYIFQHSLNVAIYSLAIGVNLNFTNKKLMDIGIGSLLHDVGKIFIEQDILQKPDRLSDEEFEIVKNHTVLGYRFLSKNGGVPSVVAHCAYEHHERLDGSGYPRGLVGNELHTYAKVIGVADVFDAVTSNRVYRDAMLPHEGLEILYAGAVHLFDKEMVEAFKKSIVVFPIGLSVELSDGRKGVVARQNQHLCDRPVIRVVKEKETEVAPYEIDLSKVLNLTIVSVMKD